MMACQNRWFARVWGLGDDGVDCYSWLEREGESKQVEWVGKDIVGMLYKTQAKKSGVMHIPQDGGVATW